LLPDESTQTARTTGGGFLGFFSGSSGFFSGSDSSTVRGRVHRNATEGCGTTKACTAVKSEAQASTRSMVNTAISSASLSAYFAFAS